MRLECERCSCEGCGVRGVKVEGTWGVARVERELKVWGVTSAVWLAGGRSSWC